MTRHARALAALEAFCEREGVTLQEIRRQCRHASAVALRQRAYREVRDAAKVGRVILGKVFHRDRQTIYHGIQKLARIGGTG